MCTDSRSECGTNWKYFERKQTTGTRGQTMRRIYIREIEITRDIFRLLVKKETTNGIWEVSVVDIRIHDNMWSIRLMREIGATKSPFVRQMHLHRKRKRTKHTHADLIESCNMAAIASLSSVCMWIVYDVWVWRLRVEGDTIRSSLGEDGVLENKIFWK